MANKDNQAAFRARKAAKGLKELRGIWIKPFERDHVIVAIDNYLKLLRGEK